MKKIFFIVFLLFTFSARSQLQFYSLPELLQYADSNAIVIKNAQIQQRISSARQKDAKSFLYPTINGSAGFNDNLTLQPTLVPAQLFNANAPEGSFKEMKFGKQYLYSTGVQLQWNILDFQKIFASKTAAIQVKADISNSQLVKFNTYNQLASTYYSILMDKEAIKIYQKNVQVATDIQNVANEKYNKGIISEADYNQAQIQNIKCKRDLENTQQDLTTLFKQLQTQINFSDSIAIPLEDSTEKSDERLNADHDFPEHPEIAWQKTQLELANASLKESEALRTPSISAGYQYNYGWAMNSFSDFNGASHLPQQYVALKLNLPIFTGFSTKQKIIQSKLQVQQQALQLENMRLTENKQDQILVIQFSQALSQLQKNKALLDLQERNDFHYANQYNSGILSLDSRLTKYKDLLTAQNDYLQSLANYKLYEYRLYIRQLNFQ
ncbi:TolC family protein [Rhizosphaericola mali]|uniref:TolC family protein n=1 Tax=Rhizosphaericola mali TaxID=2545455 RepID=A0A5P2G9R0_9BACT|nr:TolC family protein [Rhizosphaericola mali]QES90682.1 TolC family protein [Rhizosphaericola mali]